MSKFKVLYVHTLPVISGSGLAVYLMMRGLNKDRYEVEFSCAPGGPLIDKVASSGIKVYPIRHFVQRIHIIKDILALMELTLLIRRRRYAIIHTHNSKAGFIGRIAAKINGVPIIVHTIHGFAFHNFERPFRRKLFIMLERIVASFTNRLFVISMPLRDWGLKMGIGNHEKYVLNYDGIEIESFKKDFNREKIRKELNLRQEDKVVGMVAKLWEGKGHKYLLEAAVTIINKIPNVKFMIVGDGYLRDYLLDYAKRLGISNYVIFTGFRDDIPEITSIFDIACLPSLFEGMGRVLLEAQALGIPVVATSVGGITEVVKDNQTGILVNPADCHALATAIIRLLNDEALARKYQKAAREYIDEKFSARRMVENVDRVYSELTEKKGL